MNIHEPQRAVKQQSNRIVIVGKRHDSIRVPKTAGLAGWRSAEETQASLSRCSSIYSKQKQVFKCCINAFLWKWGQSFFFLALSGR